MAGERSSRWASVASEVEYRKVDPLGKLVHTWQLAGAPGIPTLVSCLVEAIEGGTHITPPTHWIPGWAGGAALEGLARLLGRLT
jgi:hypothetical protein